MANALASGGLPGFRYNAVKFNDKEADKQRTRSKSIQKTITAENEYEQPQG
jgi:hypothetical protein